ncbi:response regulator transcription factor [Comamonas composti]|uniref:response regulator transcription factor n=1 Tax=Comamonas composti TaxID=408558 RepID=UPI000A01F5FB|nr:response regulator transcription factor [Comamonas composti]
MPILRVVIADDHPLMVMGIRELLEQDANITVEATAFSSSELVALLEKSLPDVIITDYNMPGDDVHGDGIQFISYLLRRFKDIKLIILTMLSNPMILSSLYDAGVHGVVMKSQNLNEIIQAVKMVRLGTRYYAPGFKKKSSNDISNTVEDQIKNLTPREFEVLRLFSQGLTIGEIAEHLCRSIKTVSTQKSSAMRKLNVQTNQDLIAFFVKNSIFQN